MNNYFWFILLSVALTISSGGTGQDFSYRLEHGNIMHGDLSRFSFIDDLDNNAYSEMIKVADIPEFPYRIEIADLFSRNHLHSKIVRHQLQDVEAYDLDGNGQKEILYTYQSGDSVFLYIYNPFNRDVFVHHKVLVVNSRMEDEYWDGSLGINNDDLVDLNHDGHPDLLMNMHANYDLYPRGIMAYDVYNKRVMWKYYTGTVAGYMKVRDINQDGHYEIFFDTGSPGNGAEMNGTDDYHSYFIVLNEKGERIFQKTMGGQNSTTNIRFESFKPSEPPRLLTITRASNYEDYDDAKIVEWAVDSTLQFFQKRVNDGLRFRDYHTTIIPYQGVPHLAIVNSRHQICLLDSTLRLVTVLPFNEKFMSYRGAYDLTGDGRREFVWQIEGGTAAVINADLEMIYKIPNLRKISEFETGRDAPKRSGVFYGNGEFYDVQLRPIPFWQKYLNRPTVIGALLLILLGAAAIWILYYSRSGNWQWYRKQLQYFDNSLSAILVTNAKGNIIACNKKCERLLNRPGEEIASESLFNLFQNRWEPVGEWVKVQFAHKQNRTDEFNIDHGEQRQALEVYLQFIRSQRHRTEGAVLIINDVTPIVQSQQTASWINVAQKLAHEIKNPLSTIQLSLQRLKMEYEHDRELRDRLEEIVEGSLEDTRRVRKVVDDFMHFSKIESANPTCLQLEKLIQSLVNRYLLTLPEEINIQTEFVEPLPQVQMDESQLMTALTNLLDNAIQSISSAGEIHIKVHEIEHLNQNAEIPQIDRKIEIEITDTGRGMDEATQQKLFQPFFTTKEGGSGLGMIIVKRIIEDHGGTIEVFSKQGFGSRVTIQLPLVHPKSKS